MFNVKKACIKKMQKWIKTITPHKSYVDQIHVGKDCLNIDLISTGKKIKFKGTSNQKMIFTLYSLCFFVNIV